MVERGTRVYLEITDSNLFAEPLPDQVVAGVAIQATPKLMLLADYQFTRWSMFDVLPLGGTYLQKDVVEAYNNTNGIRLGAEYVVAKKHVVRVGFDGHGAAAPDLLAAQAAR